MMAVFVRYLGYLIQRLSAADDTMTGSDVSDCNITRYRKFLSVNTRSIRTRASSPHNRDIYTAQWFGPFNHSSVMAQTSALEAFVAANM